MQLLKSPKQTGVVYISTFRETFATSPDTVSLLATLALNRLDEYVTQKQCAVFSFTSAAWHISSNKRLSVLKHETYRLWCSSLDAKFLLLTFFGERNLSSPMARVICKSLLVYNSFGIQIWCNTKLLDVKKSLQIQQMPTEYNESNIQWHFKEKLKKCNTA